MAICLMITGWNPEPWVQRILAARPDLDIRIWPEIGEVCEIDYALVWKPEPAVLHTLPNLKVIFSLGAGVDHIFTGDDLPDVPIVRIVDKDLTNRMSEYIVMHCLMIQRRFRVYDAMQQRCEWVHADDVAAHTVRVGVMGTGVLGRDAAHKLTMMGFDVAAWGRTEKVIEGLPVFHGEAGFKPFLARTDILVCLLPLTADTTGILNRAVFSGLAQNGVLDGPWVINAGRGGLQRESDILTTLDDGTLAGAVLDVFETEPLPPYHSFWTHPKVTLTPHNAAMSDPDALTDYVVRQIGRYESGQPLENVVDPSRGY